MAITEYNYIPEYTRLGVNNKPKDVITASYWNGLFNMLSHQGDHTAKELGNILNHFTTAINDVKGIANGKYVKPTDGIPKTDLAAAVQTSLNKADTALQTHQSLAAYRTAFAQDMIDSDLGDRISAIENKESGWDAKQDKLIAGDNITIAADGKTISATGGSGSTIELDTTLSETGKAADAKAVGDALTGKQNTISDLETIRSGAAKGATALQSVPSTYRTALAQDVIDSDLGDRIEVIEGKEAVWDGKYVKPTSGIPKTDLANDVQASLGKADTALQSVPSTYRTAAAQDAIDSGKVDKVTGKGLSTNDYTNAAKAKVDALAPVATSGNYNDLSNKPTIPAPITEQTVSGWGFTKNTGTYSKPTGGIPKTDLASTVQTSLGKADTALQTHQSLADYRTALAQDIIDSDLSDRIEVIEGKEADWNGKQDKLIAGANITIAADGKTISATGGGGGSSVELDATLTQSGKAADAKAVGDAIAGKQDTISDLATIRSGAAKGATALQAVPSTYRTAFAQDIIDSDLDDRISVIEGAGYLTLATLPKYEGVVE